MAYILISRRVLDLFYRIRESLNDIHYPAQKKAYVKRLKRIRQAFSKYSARVDTSIIPEYIPLFRDAVY